MKTNLDLRSTRLDDINKNWHTKNTANINRIVLRIIFITSNQLYYYKTIWEEECQKRNST